MLGYYTIVVLFMVVIWAALFRPGLLWYLYVGALPFFGIIAEVGVQVTPILVVSVGMLLAMLIAGLHRVIIPKVVFNFLVYSIMITVIMSFYLPEEVKDYPLFRGKLRWVAQILVTLLFYMPVLFLFIFTPGRDHVRRMINTFLGVVVLLGVLGIIQIMVHRVSGTDLFPIDLFSPQKDVVASRSGLSDIFKNSRVLRMSSLGAGEPKHFGYTCVIALALLLLIMIFGDRKKGGIIFFQLAIMGLLTICIISTLSTQAFLILGANIVMIFLILVFKKGFFNKTVFSFVFFLGIGGFIIMRNDYVNRVVEARIYERLEETGAVEDFNLTIIDFLKNNPSFIVTGAGLGQVHLFSQKYIPIEFRYYMRDSVYVAKAGFLRVLSEQGMIGIILLFSLIGYLVLKLGRIERITRHGLITIVLVFIIVVNCDYMISTDAAPYYIFSYALGFIMLRNYLPDAKDVPFNKSPRPIEV